MARTKHKRLSDGMVGAIPQGQQPKAPKEFGEGRVCEDNGCSTKLTKYNRSTFCYAHQPYKKARLRGRTVQPGQAKIYKCRFCATRQTAWRGKFGTLPEREHEGMIHRMSPDGSTLCVGSTR